MNHRYAGEGGRVFSEEEEDLIRVRLGALDKAKGAVERAAPNRAPDAAAKLESKGKLFKSALMALLDLAAPLNAVRLVEAGNGVNAFLQATSPGSPKEQAAEMEFRTRAKRRIAECASDPAQNADQDFLIASLRGVHLFGIRATVRVAEEVQTVIWTLLAHAGREKKDQRKKIKLLRNPQGPETSPADTGNGPASGGGAVAGGGSDASISGGGDGANDSDDRLQTALAVEAQSQMTGASGGNALSGVPVVAGTGDIGNEYPDATADEAATSASAAIAGVTAGASVSSVSVEDIKKGQFLEYRWGSEGEWYRCAVARMEGEGPTATVELEFIPSTNRKTKAVKSFTEFLAISELVASGDLAARDTNCNWGKPKPVDGGQTRRLT